MLLKGKKALITGSSRGIGKETVKRFLEEGAEVWGLCTKPSASKAELETFAAEKGSAFHEIYADCGDAAALTDTVKKALEEIRIKSIYLQVLGNYKIYNSEI